MRRDCAERVLLGACSTADAQSYVRSRTTRRSNLHDARFFVRPLRRDPLVRIWLVCVAVATLVAASRYIDPGAPFQWVLAVALVYESLVTAFWALLFLLAMAVVRWLVRGGLSLGRRESRPVPARHDGPVGPVEEQLPPPVLHATPRPHTGGTGGVPVVRGVTLPSFGSDDEQPGAGSPRGDLRLLTISGRTIPA